MYDPFAPPQLPPPGQMQTTAVPQQVGMVPGVPGSVGLNPGAGGPVMTPGGGGTGAPLQGHSANNALGGFMQSAPFQTMMQSPEAQAFLQANPQFQHFLSPGAGMGWPGMRPGRQAMMDWRGARPDHQTYTGTDWRGAIQDWRSQRPGMSPQPGAPMPTPTPVATGAPMDPVHAPQVMDPARMWNVPGAGTLSSPRRGPGGGSGF